MTLLPEHPSVLTDGKDARTDAIVAACEASPSKPELSGISEIRPPGMLARCPRFLGGVSLTDVDLLAEFARDVQPQLAIIGPEEPLYAGAVDRLEDDFGIPCFGPRSELARIETSKSWARELLTAHSIEGNPDYRVFRSTAGLERFLRELGGFVVKPDGLSGGKGVKVFGDHLASISEAMDYASALIDHDGLLVIEERLDGEEFSLQTITDGETFVHCPIAQDHKRAREEDEGPNTGGMGSYSCPDFSLPFLTTDEVESAQSINERVIRALHDETGRPYRGVLYGGFMATASGIKLIEYNARFGDPEAMNVIPIMSSDFLEVCWRAAIGELDQVAVSFEPKATVCKYVVPAAYPDGKGAGDVIDVEPLDPADGDTRLYWAAVNQVDSQVLLTGSRALALVGIGETVEAAEQRAEAAMARVHGPVRHRRDIGTESAIKKRIGHMEAIRRQPSRIP
jgi:phosphoribosylamine---glycine ligase